VLAILTFVVANQTLSAEKSRKALIYGVGVGILTAAIDLINLEYRLFVPAIQTFVPMITGAIVLVAGFFIARRAWGGNLRNKLLVAFIGVTVIATGVLGAYMITTSSNNLQENLERELSKVTLDRASRIGDLINEQINTLTAVSLNEALQSAVETQNSSYEGDAAFIQATLDTKDAQWQRADEADNNADPLVRENLTNAVARELLEYQQTFPANVEVFITDVYGGLAGTTNRTSDYFQADEGWWQAAYNNGEGAVYIAEPEFDESAGAIGVNIALPLRDQDTGEITGILRTTYIVSPLTTILADKVGQTGEADLYFPGEVVSHIREGEFGPAEVGEFEALQAVADQGMAEMEYDGTLSVVSQAQVQTLDGSPAVDNLGWVVVMHQHRDEAFAPVNEAIQGFIIVLLVVIALAAAAAYGFSLFLVRPIAQLTVTAEEVSAGNLDSRAEVTTSDEVGILATAFNTMTSQLQETLESLEQRVADRTKALATSAEVTRRLATILDPSQLVGEVVNEVRNAFDYYYAQIYLLDKAGDNLVIAGGTGEAGASMLASGHSVPKGRGLVGRAADANASVLVSDTHQEEGWLPNELLPETKSEAAIPISVGNQVFGVLDVQHSLVNGLTEEDVTLLESLAGQVAISLQNARSYEQSRKQAELESLVNLIGQRIQRTTTIEDTLQTAIRELGGALGATRVRAKLQRASTSVETASVEPAEPVMVAETERKNGSSSPDELLIS
jgi:GAF domain-containing protein